MQPSFPWLARQEAFRAVLLCLALSHGLSCGNLRPSCGSTRERTRVPSLALPATSATATGGIATSASDGGTSENKRAILVSVDGLGALYLQPQLDKGKLPSFAALKRAGASTLNARADYDYTVTLPNHTSMITGRPVWRDENLPATTHHGWTINALVDSSTTLHNAGNPSLSYVASVFDVVHDHGKKTCMYAGKSKFSLFSSSYNAENGAADTVGEDNGRNKIDRVVIIENGTELLVSTAEGDLAAGMCDFAFIHIADLDWQGHSRGWGSDSWFETLGLVDGWIGRLAKFADGNKTQDPYFMVVTADHGGASTDHGDATLPIDYTIPFYVVGPGFTPNANLYALANDHRADPGSARPRNSARLQPVRNADAANVITTLLSLPPVPGSFMRDLLKPH